ncbi:MAG: hypothetical protein ACR2G5_07300 [Pyrinomonadaceae bacterium]
MNRNSKMRPTFRAIPFRSPSSYALALIALCTCMTLSRQEVRAQNSSQTTASTDIANSRSPSDTVREFYKAMREKRFREAFAMSIYKPAIEGLKPEEFEDLRPDFERIAAVMPDRVEINGEQLSADEATVFIKVKADEKPEQAEPVTLIRVDGNWIVGDKENQEIVKKAGKTFFFKARIDTHHSEVQAMLQRIAVAQLVYSQQHAGKFGNMATLISAALIPKDVEGTESTGYRFRITVSPDGRSWSAAAEPAKYGRSGRLSFFMDKSGVRSGDVSGKPLPASPLRN